MQPANNFKQRQFRHDHYRFYGGKAMLNVCIEIKEMSQPIERLAANTYIKGPMFCVFDGKKVEKYPIANIFRVTEDYHIEAGNSAKGKNNAPA